jgi:hypothetical protein
VTAKYCSSDDLTNQVDNTKGWVWNEASNKFVPAQ